MKNKIIVLVLVVFIIIGFVWVFFKGNVLNQQEVSMSDPVDVVLDFYDPWLDARKSETTDPYKEGLDKSPILSKELRSRISKAKGQSDTEVDPVLCQVTVPTVISGRPLYESEDKVEILILARDKGLDGQAVVVLNKLNGGWYINDIKCSPGEFAPPREFSFEREGYLLKSVPAPLNSKYWHLVFEENDELGHVAPLFFGEESICILSNGDESVCNPDQFLETSKATVYGEMSESGVSVKKLRFMEE